MFRSTAHLRHGNQRWLVGVPVNLFAFIHQAWQMFWFVNDEQLQLAGMCWRTGAAILVSQLHPILVWGCVHKSWCSVRLCMIQLLLQQQQQKRSSPIIQCPSSCDCKLCRPSRPLSMRMSFRITCVSLSSILQCQLARGWWF